MDMTRSFLVQPDVVSRRIDDELILINLESDRIFALNSTGTRFWELLASGGSVGAARDALLEEYDVAVAPLEAEMDGILQQLIAEGFLIDAVTV